MLYFTIALTNTVCDNMYQVSLVLAHQNAQWLHGKHTRQIVLKVYKFTFLDIPWSPKRESCSIDETGPNTDNSAATRANRRFAQSLPLGHKRPLCQMVPELIVLPLKLNYFAYSC